MKSMKAKFEKFPKDMTQAKVLCEKLCRERGLAISFDDKSKNFGDTWNMCMLAVNGVECARFCDWNHDLLVFAVMHELGHHFFYESYENVPDEDLPISSHKFKNTLSREFECWQYAIDLYIKTFGRNIGIKQARYMMHCLQTYVPDYNQTSMNNFSDMNKDYLIEIESNFWCPLKQKVLR